MAPIVLVHGIWKPGEMRWLEKGFQQYEYPTLRPELRPVIRLPELFILVDKLEAYIEDKVESHTSLHLVGFSMGGLLCRCYAQRYPNRILSLSTISAPHQGSLLGKIFPFGGYQNFNSQSEFMTHLASRDSALTKIPMLSIRTPLDLMVVPASSSIWHLATNKAFPVIAHPLMVRNKQVFNAVLAHIQSV